MEEGLSNAQGNKLDNIEGDTIKKREESYVEKVSNIICDEILGSQGNRAQWSVPIEKEKGAQTQHIGTINMENYRIRSIIENLKQIVLISIPEQEQQQLWFEMLDHYNNLMVIMRKKRSDYTD